MAISIMLTKIASGCQSSWYNSPLAKQQCC